MALTPFLSHPMLFYGLSFLLGTAYRFCFDPLYILLLTVLIFAWKEKAVMISSIALFGFIYSLLTVSLPSISKEGENGHGIFHPHTLSSVPSSFGTSWKVEGRLAWSFASGKKCKNIPCTYYTPFHKKRPYVGSPWKVSGKLVVKEGRNYVIKPASLHIDASRFCAAQIRFIIKDHIRQHLTNLFPHPATHSFLLSLMTAELDSHLLTLQFHKTGLLHLLGISGFQFSLLSAMLYKGLRLFFTQNTCFLACILLLGIYTTLLGYTPPIGRAFITTTLYTLSLMYSVQCCPLNNLGIAAMIQLLLDPRSLFGLGFQFSFLCALALILIYPICHQKIGQFFITRSFYQIQKLTGLDQVGYVTAYIGKQLIALNAALLTVSFPLMLYHFHKISFLSVIYNLFIPPFISLAYLTLIPAFCLSYLSQTVAKPFIFMTNMLTEPALFLVANPPLILDIHMRSLLFNPTITTIYLAVLLTLFYKRRSFIHEFL